MKMPVKVNSLKKTDKKSLSIPKDNILREFDEAKLQAETASIKNIEQTQSDAVEGIEAEGDGRKEVMNVEDDERSNIDPAAEESDSSEEEVPPINTAGDVPLEWYKDEEHIGYDILGRKYKKKERQDMLDSFLASVDDSDNWHKIYDDYNDAAEVELTKEESKFIKKMIQRKAQHADFDPHAPYVDWFQHDVKHPLSNAPEPKRRFIDGTVVATKCTSTRSQSGDGISAVIRAMSDGKYAFDLGNEKGKHEPFKHLDDRAWLPAENVIVSDPEFSPGVISEYLQVSENLRKNLTHKLRKHLLYVGWKIEYRKEPYMTRMRYTSPTGKVYMSLVKICDDIVKYSGCVIFEDKGIRTPSDCRSRKMLLDRSDVSRQPKVTSSPPTGNAVVFEPEFCPEAVERWCKYVTGNGSLHSQCRETDSLKAKKHLSAMGWTFFYIYKETKRELRYMSPRGKVYYSLRTACEDCIIGTANVKFETPGRCKPTENPSKGQVRHASKSVVLGSKRVREASIHSPSLSNPRTVLSWLIDRSVVLPGARVRYVCRKSGQPLKSGQVSREGISCDCCGKIYSLSAFESHAGSSIRRPSANIFLEDGRSLMECQRQMLNQATELATEKNIDQQFKRSYPENDILCCICHYAGELMLCDRCPASFHMICLGLTEIPDGDWFCPSCRCTLCGLGEFKDISSEADVLRCYQCEHLYHLSCLRKGGASIEIDARGNRFCSAKCRKICTGLNNLLGKPFELIGSDNLTWTLVATNKWGSSQSDLAEMDTLTENHSKLNVALSIMHECFEPLKDYRTKRDIVEHVIFSRSSEYSRLNYRGFYTVLLEQNEELITAATLRIFGDKVAEVPLVGTRLKYRRLGMCRFLMNELERKLTGLGIERLVLPAVPGVLKTWTNSFGFSQMTESERLQFLSYTFLDFLGTTICQKFLQELPGDPTPSPGLQHDLQRNKIVDHSMALELRTCDDSVVLVNQIRTCASCTTEGLTQTSELLQERSEEQSMLERESVILNADQQATNCKPPTLQQDPIIYQMNCEAQNVPEMVQVRECWKELKSVFEIDRPEREKQRLSIAQLIPKYQLDDKSSQDTASLTYLALQTTPSITGRMSHEEQHASEHGHEDNTNEHSKLNDECVQDQFSQTTHVSNILESKMGPSIKPTILRRKKGRLDICDLKVYERRVRMKI